MLYRHPSHSQTSLIKTIYLTAEAKMPMEKHLMEFSAGETA
jgi:hypothetical protein